MIVTQSMETLLFPYKTHEYLRIIQQKLFINVVLNTRQIVYVIFNTEFNAGIKEFLAF